METNRQIVWEGLACVFEGRTVFTGFSGSLSNGERLRVTGPSGSGKTTFLLMLLGLVAPAAGTVTWCSDIRTLAAYVPQEPDLGTSGTVRAWIDTAFAYRRNRAVKPTREALGRTLETLGLPPAILDEDVTAISGGEKQRVALALALLLPRAVMILDEPFSALDVASAERAAAALRDSGRTVVYASHADAVADFATREVAP